jgi:Arc/MetJ-type ribon-helix-helix transcriptional regulator
VLIRGQIHQRQSAQICGKRFSQFWQYWQYWQYNVLAVMTIQLKPEQERIIEAEIRNGHFRSVEEVLDHALAALLAKSSALESEPRKPRKNLAQFLMESPLAGSGLDLTRDKDLGRDIEL